MNTTEVKSRTPEEYINDFHMDDKDQRKFDHTEFLIAFGQEFNNLISHYIDQWSTIDYPKFRYFVRSMYNKFLDIKQTRKKHKNLSDNLWKTFYAMYVVPKRRELFPTIQEKIDEKRGSNK